MIGVRPFNSSGKEAVDPAFFNSNSGIPVEREGEEEKREEEKREEENEEGEEALLLC